MHLLRPRSPFLPWPTRLCGAFALLVLLGCGALNLGFAASALSPAAAPPQSGPRVASYKLQPMDLIKIQFFQESELDRELRVSQDHAIVLALVGSVNIKDRSVRETELLIADLYRKDYLVNPQISITILEYAQRTVTVLGAVGGPGTVVLPPERSMTLLDVIARSGGFSRLANQKSVSLTRNLPDGRTANFTINAEEMMTGDKNNQWPVMDGDIISVPERLL
jgi:polysaccharide export outer membrane protein